MMLLLKPNQILQLIVVVLFITTMQSCTTTPSERLHFLDVSTGQSVIIRDQTEFFFENIQSKDIQLQLKIEADMPLDSLKVLYCKELENSVLDFTALDKKRLTTIFNEIEREIQFLNPLILLDSIQLLKIDPYLYGESVFYTRGKAIIIPANRLEDYNKQLLKEIMIHEIFHLYSRQHRDSFRATLYELVHFYQLEKPLTIPSTVLENILLNPDGLAQDWYFETAVESNGAVYPLLPLLVTTNKIDVSSTYFEQLTLRFYRLFENESGFYIEEEAYYQEEDLVNLYDKITDNTDYIIHPDEILAENFVLLLLAQEDQDILNKLSDNGRQLIADLRAVLQQPFTRDLNQQNEEAF